MTTERISPAAGQSIDTDPVAWPGGMAKVTVRGVGAGFGLGTELVIEGQELRADGVLVDWKPCARFQQDDERNVAIPPGFYRWHVNMDHSDLTRRAWDVTVADRLAA